MNKKIEKFDERFMNMADQLGNVFKEEAEFYKLKGIVNFMIIPDTALSIVTCMRTKDWMSYEPQDLMDKYKGIEYCVKGNLITTMTWDHIITNDGKIIPLTDVLLLNSALTRILMACDNDDNVISAMRTFIKHELGHVIDDINIMAGCTDVDKAAELHIKSTDILNKHYDAYNAIIEKYNITNEKLKLKLYYKIPEEAKANSNAGITFKDIWKAEQLLNDK
jgi:hypothetical protein